MGRPLLFVAAGANEVGVWDLEKGGKCEQCFRAEMREEVRRKEGGTEGRRGQRGREEMQRIFVK